MADRLTFINLPVADLEASKNFFGRLDFRFDPRFCDRSAACMVISDKAFAMLLQRERFAEFAARPVGDPVASTTSLICVSADDRAGVDRLADAALAAGGAPARAATDFGFMYGRSFFDLDGHHWEVMWMDPAAVETGPDEYVDALQA